MPTSADPRHINFARFVKRACDHAKETHGWSVAEVAERAGISRSTLNRWRAGEFANDPKGGEVADFCNTLDIDPRTAFAILWPATGERPAEPTPLPLEPAVEKLLRRLRDPAVADEEKYLIRETLEALAARTPDRKRRTG